MPLCIVLCNVKATTTLLYRLLQSCRPYGCTAPSTIHASSIHLRTSALSVLRPQTQLFCEKLASILRISRIPNHGLSPLASIGNQLSLSSLPLLRTPYSPSSTSSQLSIYNHTSPFLPHLSSVEHQFPLTLVVIIPILQGATNTAIYDTLSCGSIHNLTNIIKTTDSYPPTSP